MQGNILHYSWYFFYKNKVVFVVQNSPVILTDFYYGANQEDGVLRPVATVG